MPNLMNQVFGQTSTFQVINDIRNDALSIKASLIGTYKDASDYVGQMSATNPHFKHLMGWFAEKSGNGTPSSLDTNQDDEFDPGYSMDDTADESAPMIMDAKSMKTIEDARVAAMADIAKNKMQSDAVSSAAIVEAINARSVDIVASLRKTSGLTRGILSRMNAFLDAEMSAAERMRRFEREFIDANGRVTIQSVREYMDGVQKGTSSGLAAGIMRATGIGEIDQAVADKILNAQASIFEKIFSMKWLKKVNPFGKKGFGDKDYSRYIVSKYDRDPAVFDNITRKAITDIIPGYLKRITEVLTSKRFNISERGELTTDPGKNFGMLVRETLATGSLTEDVLKPLATKMQETDKEFKSVDVKEAHRVLVSQYVALMYRNGKKVLPTKAFENGGSPEIMKKVTMILVQTKGKDAQYWNRLMTMIRAQLQLNKRYRSQVANTINKTADRLHKAAREYALNSNGAERLQFTQEMFDKAAIERLSVDATKFEHDGKTLRQLVQEGVIKKSSLTADQLREYDEPIHGFADFQYQMRQMESTSIANIGSDMMERFKILKGIYNLLNRGVNVYFMPGSVPKYKMPTRQQQSQSQQQIPTDTGPTESQQIPMNPNGKPAASPLSSIKAFASGALSKIKGFFSSKSESGDSERVAEVLASMKAAAQSGDISDEEASDLSARASGIENQKQRSIIQRSIDGTKSRSKNKKQPKTLLGKALFYVFGLGKSFISNILSKAKTFLLNGAKWVANTMIKGIKNVVSGIGSVGSGMLSLGKRTVGAVAKGVSKVKNIVKDYRDANQTQKMMLTRLKASSHLMAESASNIEIVETNVDVIEDEETEKGLLSRLASSIADKLKNSSFVKGFMSAWQKDKPKVEQTLEDRGAANIDKIVKNPDPVSTFFGSVLFRLDKIKTGFEEKFRREKVKEKQTADGSEENPKTKKQGIGFDLGKLAGGMSKIFVGIMQSVGAVVAGMSGLKALMEIPKQILEKSLQPLNKVFQTLVVSLKPIVKTIQKIVAEIVEYIVAIAESVIDIMQPILEAIGPIIDQIMEALRPILDMLTDLINILVVPLVGVMMGVVIPVLKTIANTLSIQLGMIQVSFGLVLVALGAILTGVGMIGKLFGAGSLKEQGKSMIETGKSLLSSGFQAIKTGTLGMLNMVKETINDVTGAEDETETTVEEAPKKREIKASDIPSVIGSPMDGVTGSGDEDGMHKFSEPIQNAYKNLKTLTTKLFSVFDLTEDDSTAQRLREETNQNTYEQTKAQVESSNMSDEDKAAIDQEAFELFKKENAKYAGESDKDYEKRYDQSKTMYWTKAAATKLKDLLSNSPGDNATNALSFIDTQLAMDTDGNISSMKGFTESLLTADSDIQQGSATRSISESMANTVGYARSTSSGGYDVEDLIRAVAKVYKAYGDAYPKVPYYNDYDATRKIVVDGKTRGIRPDCSGIISAAIQTMGYKLKNAGDAGRDSHSFANANANDLIMDADGKLSSDWTVLPFSVSALQRGDITARPGHVSMPITQLTADWPKGFDGGNSSNVIGKDGKPGDHIPKSVVAANAYLSGDANWESYLPSAMGKKWSSAGGATKIWRFIGKPVSSGTAYTGDGTKMEAKDLYKYLVHNLGMSAIGASGILGILHYESGMRSNNLEDEYNKKAYFGMSDEEYTRRVDTGAETKQQFVYGRYFKRSSNQTAGEAVGYGLSQFTSSNLKKDLYERTVERGKSVSDAPSQLDMIISHLKKMKYKGTSLFNAISSASTPTEANQYYFWRYASGTSKNSDAEVLRAYSTWMTQKDIDNRHAMAEKYYAQFRGSGDEPITQEPIMQETPTIQPDYVTSVFDLNGALDRLTQNVVKVESQTIKSLVSDIFDELPEYLEDDDDEDIYEEEPVYM